MRSLRMDARLLGVMAASCLLLACDGSDPVATSIRNASLELRSVNPSGGPTPSAQVRRTKYQTALSALKAPGGEPNSSQVTAIALLTAEAEAGLAVVPLSEAIELDWQVLSDVREARALLAQWRSHKISEMTARQYDPATELAQIAEDIAERDSDITRAEGVKAAIDDRIRGHQAQISEKMTEANAERETEADLRSRARGTTAVEGAELIKSARAHQRIADALEVESELLQAEVDQFEREAAEAQLEIDRRRMQRELLLNARMDVQERAAAASEQAGVAADDANASAIKLNEVLVRIEDARATSSAMSQAYDDAFAGLRRALSAANRARNDQRVRSSANAVIGTIQQTLGDAHTAREHGFQAYTNLLEALVAAGPDLDGSAGHAAALDQARADLAEQQRLAAEAYQAARSAYASTRLRDADAQERMQHLDGLLQEFAPAPTDG